MPIHDDRTRERPVRRGKIAIGSAVHWRAPGSVGAGMHQGEMLVNLRARRPAQPREPILAHRATRLRSHFLNRVEQRLEVRQATRETRERLRIEQHFVGVAEDALPSEIANAIDHFAGRDPLSPKSPPWRMRSGDVSRRSAECFEGREIAVFVGHDGGAHGRAIPGLAWPQFWGGGAVDALQAIVQAAECILRLHHSQFLIAEHFEMGLQLGLEIRIEYVAIEEALSARWGTGHQHTPTVRPPFFLLRFLVQFQQAQVQAAS